MDRRYRQALRALRQTMDGKQPPKLSETGPASCGAASSEAKRLDTTAYPALPVAPGAKRASA